MRRSVPWVSLSAVAVVALATIAHGPPAGVRSSVAAAYRAFCQPSLLDPKPPPPPPPAAPPPPGPVSDARPPVVPDADVDRELEGASPDDLDDPDGATIAALTLPDLRVPITRRALRYVRYFARTEGGKKVFLGCYRRGTRYRDAIEEALRTAELPLDLAWLPAIESGFDPRAVSPAGAAGLWQLMPNTARSFGLTRTTWMDQRLDVPRATRAAVTHLGALHRRFGRWDLALAAYNAGSGRVESAVGRLLRERGPGPVTLADLGARSLLPEETLAYVPQVIAYAIVAINAEKFGIDVPDAVAPPEPSTLLVPEGTRIDTIARAAGVSVDVVRDLNPSLLGDRVPPRGGAIRVAVPRERVEEAKKALPACRDHEVVVQNDPEDDPDGGAPGAAVASVDEPQVSPGSPASIEAPREAPEIPAEPFEADPPPVAPRVSRWAPDLVLREPSLSVLPDPTILHVRLAPVSVGAQLGYGALADSHAPLHVGPPPDKAPPRSKPVAAARPSMAPPEGVELMRAVELPNGVVIRSRRDASAPEVTITTRLASLADPAGSPGGSEALATIRVDSRDVVAGLSLAAARLGLALSGAASRDVAALRKGATAARRRTLERSPYGRSWIILGDMLFPPRHPLAGSVLGAASDSASLRDLLLADLVARERAGARPSVTVTGDVEEGYVERLATALFGAIPTAVGAPPSPVLDRVFIEANVSEARALYGWVVDAPSPEDEAAIRVAMEILGGERIARLHRVLVTESGLATSVHARMEQVAIQARVVVIELILAPGHNVDDVERALFAELSRLSAEGVDATDAATAGALARDKLDEELSATALDPPPAAASSALAASLRRALAPGRGALVRSRLDVVTTGAVASAIRRLLPVERRAIVITTPRRHPGEQRVAMQR